MQRPRISTNLAISADGKISSVSRAPSGWTSKQDHARLLTLRANADALLVGKGTWESDRMTMLVPGKTIQPLRCVVSRSGDFDTEQPLFHTTGGDIHLLITGEEIPDLPEFAGPNVTIHSKSLGDFLESLALKYAVKNLHCEGGGQLIRALAELDVIDEFHLTLAGHTLFGGLGAGTATGIPAEFLPATREYEVSHFEARPDLGECFVSYICPC
ncbi:MAG: dihydrofolate reductase family protein [Luteolibacter sp.]